MRIKIHIKNRCIDAYSISNDSVHENETKESKGRLLLIIVKGEHIFDTNGKTLGYQCKYLFLYYLASVLMNFSCYINFYFKN